ncbi:ATP-dependent Clp protease adaptor ClpS [Lentzea sp. NPDC004789]
MSPGERWAVVVHNDDHTPFAVANHLLRTVCGFDADTALGLTTMIHQSGGAGVGVHDRETAESIALRLVRAGLRAELRQAGDAAEEIFSAQRVDGGVRVMVPEHVARGWEPAFQVLEGLYRRNTVVFGLRFPRPIMMRRAVLRRMFPDVSVSRWRSASFRRRHRKVLADRALVDRVWDQWINAAPRTLTLDEVEEWIVAFGQIRALQLLVRKATPLHFQTISHIQHQLVAAADELPENASAN